MLQIKHSFDASPLRPEKSEQQILSRQLDRNLSSESLIERRTSITSINRLERRNSGSWNSNHLSKNILGIEDVTDLPDNTHNNFGTSVEEQRRILEEIQKSSRRRSISRNRLENITTSSTSNNYYRAKSTEYTNFVQDDSNRRQDTRKKSVKSVSYQESSLEVTVSQKFQNLL